MTRPVMPSDPMILLSVLNTKLRDAYDSLAALCEDLGADEDEIREKLARIGYEYHADVNQFR